MVCVERAGPPPGDPLAASDRGQNLEPICLRERHVELCGVDRNAGRQASHDDGFLELVFIERSDVARTVANIHRLFDGTLDRVPEVQSRRFQSLVLKRKQAGPIQIDGELLEDVDTEITIRVRPRCLRVLVP